MRRDNDLRKQRDREFVALYRKKVAQRFLSKKEIVRKELIAEVLAEGRPYYHVGFEYALSVVSRMKRGLSICHKKSLRRKMWMEIMGHVDTLMMRRPHYKLSEALAIVLAEYRASQFFMSHEYARKYLYRCVHS